jgi:CRISPR-associated protein (TIGR02710 family)
MKTAYIATVGTGEAAKGSIVEALSLSAGQMGPGFVLLLATNASADNAKAIIGQLQRTDRDSRIHVLAAAPEHAERLYRETVDTIAASLREQSIAPENATADITSGTKPMSAALTLAAVKLELGYLRYVAVQKTADHEVCAGTEEMRTFRPAGFRASLLLDSAEALMRQYRFDAVRQLLADMPEHLLSDTDKASRNCLLCLADAYSHWDLFRHIQFKAAYDVARFDRALSLQDFRAAPETVSKVMELGQSLSKGRLTDLAVVDLINNARRRIEEGKFDDATARLYRGCEMLAQWKLSVLGIATDKVDLAKVPPRSRDWLERYGSGPNRGVQIGLQKSYQLLDEIGDTLGRAFCENQTFRAVLQDRNYSILAHGTKPVAREACEKLLGCVEKLAKTAVDDYEAKSALLRFPWSR